MHRTAQPICYYHTLLGQYPITLENMQVVDSDVEEDLVRVDFHIIGISPVSYITITLL